MKNVPCRASPFSLPLTWLGTAAQLYMLVMLLEVTPWPFPCVGSPEQGCRRVRWALECELTLQTNESEEMGMKTPLGTCVNRRWGKEGLWPPRLCYSSSSFGHCLLSQACSHPSVTSGTVSSQHTWCLIFIGFSILIPEFSPQCSSRNPSQLNPQIFIFLKKKKSSLHLHLFCCLRTFFSSSEVPRLTTHWVFGEIFWVSILS